MTKQSLGQNFLMHPATGERIVQAAELSKKEHVLEIGPGTGMLTRALLKEGHSVTAVEADGELVENLVETFAEEIKSKRLKLVHEDIRTFNLSSLPKKYSLVANIPYYITGEIIRTFLTAKWKPRSMTLLVQKEVAVRITGRGERNHKESLLSLSVKAYGDPKYCFTVPKGAFRPVPKVDSAVISIQDIRKDSFRNVKEEESFFELLKMGFAHKRKVLSGNLADKYGQKKVGEAFVAASIPHKARSEDLSLADWKRLFVNLS
ncbi:MAG TPA: 16S rRNA (adenine(1518)-N(6)/adenine(1519)-N(6))-dimethyltransferase RsmA [Candidatus Paceibacterota bacterium]